MPHPWALADANFPAFRGDEHPKEQVRQIVDYLMMLSEALRYQLENLDTSNWNTAAMADFQTATTAEVKKTAAQMTQALKELDEQVKKLSDLKTLIQVDDDGNITIGQEGNSLTLAGNVYINGKLME